MATDTVPDLCSTVSGTLSQQSRLQSSLSRLNSLASRLGAPPPAGAPASGPAGEAVQAAVTLAYLVRLSNAKAGELAAQLEEIVGRLEAQA